MDAWLLKADLKFKFGNLKAKASVTGALLSVCKKVYYCD